MINFEVDEWTAKLIRQAVEKIAATDYLVDLAKSVHGDDWKLGVTMDLTAVHANGCPMDWSRFFPEDASEEEQEAADMNFAHDIGGILNLLNREYEDEDEDDELFTDEYWWPRAALPVPSD